MAAPQKRKKKEPPFDVTGIDFSVITTALKLGGKMIDQIMNSVQYGSPEVRLLMREECDLIIECRVCRALFRALPNFIAHKRVYCNEAFSDQVRNADFEAATSFTPQEEEVVVIQPTAPDDDPNVPPINYSRELGNSRFPRNAKNASGLKAVAEKVKTYGPNSAQSSKTASAQNAKPSSSVNAKVRSMTPESTRTMTRSTQDKPGGPQGDKTGEKASEKSLDSTVQQINEGTLGTSKEFAVLTAAANKAERDKAESEKSAKPMQLTPIASNPCAVFVGNNPFTHASDKSSQLSEESNKSPSSPTKTASVALERLPNMSESGKPAGTAKPPSASTKSAGQSSGTGSGKTAVKGTLRSVTRVVKELRQKKEQVAAKDGALQVKGVALKTKQVKGYPARDKVDAGKEQAVSRKEELWSKSSRRSPSTRSTPDPSPSRLPTLSALLQLPSSSTDALLKAEDIASQARPRQFSTSSSRGESPAVESGDNLRAVVKRCLTGRPGSLRPSPMKSADRSMGDFDTASEAGSISERAGFRDRSDSLTFSERGDSARRDSISETGESSAGFSRAQREGSASEYSVDLDNLRCTLCDMVFQSRKSLTYHCETKHTGQRTIYPCPYCAGVFYYFWGLTRHLGTNHKKRPSDIDRMRKSLRRGAYKQDVTECLKLLPSPPFSKTAADGSNDSSSPCFGAKKLRPSVQAKKVVAVAKSSPDSGGEGHVAAHPVMVLPKRRRRVEVIQQVKGKPKRAVDLYKKVYPSKPVDALDSSPMSSSSPRKNSVMTRKILARALRTTRSRRVYNRVEEQRSVSASRQKEAESPVQAAGAEDGFVNSEESGMDNPLDQVKPETLQEDNKTETNTRPTRKAAQKSVESTQNVMSSEESGTDYRLEQDKAETLKEDDKTETNTRPTRKAAQKSVESTQNDVVSEKKETVTSLPKTTAELSKGAQSSKSTVDSSVKAETKSAGKTELGRMNTRNSAAASDAKEQNQAKCKPQALASLDTEEKKHDEGPASQKGARPVSPPNTRAKTAAGAEQPALNTDTPILSSPQILNKESSCSHSKESPQARSKEVVDVKSVAVTRTQSSLPAASGTTQGLLTRTKAAEMSIGAQDSINKTATRSDSGKVEAQGDSSKVETRVDTSKISAQGETIGTTKMFSPVKALHPASISTHSKTSSPVKALLQTVKTSSPVKTPVQTVTTATKTTFPVKASLQTVTSPTKTTSPVKASPQPSTTPSKTLTLVSPTPKVSVAVDGKHLQVEQSSQRTVFPCSYCPSMFFYFWALTQHLKADHKKHPSDIKRMTQSLRRKSYKLDIAECQQLATAGKIHSPQKIPHQARSYTPSSSHLVTRTRSIKHALKTAAKRNAVSPPRRASTSTPTSPGLLHICPHCQRAFGRKISLDSHVKICNRARTPQGEGQDGKQEVESLSTAAKFTGNVTPVSASSVSKTTPKPVRMSTRTPRDTSAEKTRLKENVWRAGRAQQSDRESATNESGKTSRSSSVSRSRESTASHKQSSSRESSAESHRQEGETPTSRRCNERRRDRDSKANSSRESSVDSIRTRDAAKTQVLPVPRRSRSETSSKRVSSRDSSVESRSSVRSKTRTLGGQKSSQASKQERARLEKDLLALSRQRLSEQLQAAATTSSDEGSAGSADVLKHSPTKTTAERPVKSVAPSVLRKKEKQDASKPSLSTTPTPNPTATASKNVVTKAELQTISSKAKEISKLEAHNLRSRQSTDPSVEQGDNPASVPGATKESKITELVRQQELSIRDKSVTKGSSKESVDKEGASETNKPEVTQESGSSLEKEGESSKRFTDMKVSQSEEQAEPFQSQRPKRKRRAPLKIADSIEDRATGSCPADSAKRQRLDSNVSSSTASSKTGDVHDESIVIDDEGGGEGDDDDRSATLVEEIWMEKRPGRPTERVRSNRIYVVEPSKAGRLTCQDTRKVGQIVDETGLTCLHCDQHFTSVSNLRRHAIRHLGWRRFKCRLCRFCSYNRSECHTHILRAHPERLRLMGGGGTRIDSLITDLNRQAASVRSLKKRQTLHSRQNTNGEEELEEEEEEDLNLQRSLRSSRLRKKAEAFVEEEMQEDSLSAGPSSSNSETLSSLERSSSSRRKPVSPAAREGCKKLLQRSAAFNISTRSSPRKFDIRPYPRPGATTRKGSSKKLAGSRKSRASHAADDNPRHLQARKDKRSTPKAASNHNDSLTSKPASKMNLRTRKSSNDEESEKETKYQNEKQFTVADSYTQKSAAQVGPKRESQNGKPWSAAVVHSGSDSVVKSDLKITASPPAAPSSVPVAQDKSPLTTFTTIKSGMDNTPPPPIAGNDLKLRQESIQENKASEEKKDDNGKLVKPHFTHTSELDNLDKDKHSSASNLNPHSDSFSGTVLSKNSGMISEVRDRANKDTVTRVYITTSKAGYSSSVVNDVAVRHDAAALSDVAAGQVGGVTASSNSEMTGDFHMMDTLPEQFMSGDVPSPVSEEICM